MVPPAVIVICVEALSLFIASQSNHSFIPTGSVCIFQPCHTLAHFLMICEYDFFLLGVVHRNLAGVMLDVTLLRL